MVRNGIRVPFSQVTNPKMKKRAPIMVRDITYEFFCPFAVAVVAMMGWKNSLVAKDRKKIIRDA